MSIVLTRAEFTVTPMRAEAHEVHLSVSGGCVVADCVCGLHAESFSSTREVFDFLASHRTGHLRPVRSQGGFRAL